MVRCCRDLGDILAGTPRKRLPDRLNAIQEIEAYNAELEYYLVFAGLSPKDPAVQDVRAQLSRYERQLKKPSELELQKTRDRLSTNDVDELLKVLPRDKATPKPDGSR